MTKHLKGCTCFLKAYKCAGIVPKPKKKVSLLTGCRCGHEGEDHGPFDDQAPRDPKAYSPLDGVEDGALSWCLECDSGDCPGMTPTQLGYSRCTKPGGLDAHPDIEGACGKWASFEEPCDEHGNNQGEPQ